MNPRDTSLRPLFGTFAALIALLVLTAGATALPTGWWSTPLSLLIAFAKAVLIFTVFMRLRTQGPLVRVFALAGFFFLTILLVLTAADFLTRQWPV
jgi:cytochrome c oxidase subunit 4